MANYFAHCKTLDDLKAEYRKAAFANHPDRGGDPAIMKRINADNDERFEELKRAHNAAADAEHQTTETPEEFRNVIAALIVLDGLDIELCGRWLWISGETRKHKDALKVAGCRWSAGKKMWYWRHQEDGFRPYRGKSTIGEIRNKYGSQRIDADGRYSEYMRERIGA